MSFNFSVIEKSASRGLSQFRSGIRVTSCSMIAGADIRNRLETHFKNTKKGSKKIQLRIEVDRENNAIKLTPDEINGFSFMVGSYSLNINMSRRVKEALKMGDYTPVDGEVNVFKLAQ